MINIFVYGTLRQGERNSHLLKNAARVAEQCWTNGALYDTGYGYPALKQAYNSRVYGELYAITESELTTIDQLEGYSVNGENNLYERIEQIVYTDQGEVNAIMYIANQDDLLATKIPNGDWKVHKLEANKMNSVHYFAYGSCMDDHRFKKARVEHYFQKLCGVGVLLNYMLRFTRKARDGGRADIVEEGGRVEGKVYEIPVNALEDYLYGREGAPDTYRPTFITIDLIGERVQALTFVVVNKEPETAPPAKYEQEILRGATGFLSDEYISKIANHMATLKEQKSGGM
ncbi:gamma-glutamylcyclotransferase [Bacillus niameyensis]|uniref:gamma-glutamylcyclotransferase n=1 Tax=Bacillus niameyensis TaxID=1522308 RepID=UPI0007848DF3|nr:gamma-glutamylcyclotransferase family protein [Bacillus niameyensis]